MQVVSNENQDLTVSSKKGISVEGHEGVFFDGKMLQFDAEQNVDISSSSVIIFILSLLLGVEICGLESVTVLKSVVTGSKNLTGTFKGLTDSLTECFFLA